MVNRTLLAALAVAALVATAGCAGLVGDDTDNPVDTPDDGTDEPTSEETPSVDEFDYPDFASQTSLSAGELRNASSDELTALDSVSITRENQVDLGENSVSRSETFQYGNDGNIALRTNETTAAGSSESFISTDGVGFTKVETSSGDSRYYEQSAPNRTDAASGSPLEAFVSSADVEAVSTTRMNGEVVVTYELTNFDTEALSGGLNQQSMSNVSASVSVDSSGMVHEFTYAYDTERADQEYSQSQTVSLSEVNSTSTSEPDWFSTARSDGTVIDTQFNDNGVVTLEVEQGTLPAGSTVFIGAQTSAEYTLEETLTAGDTLYVSQTSDGLAISESEPGTSDGTITTMYVSVSSDGVQVFENNYFSP